jgi:hypothetical protein
VGVGALAAIVVLIVWGALSQPTYVAGDRSEVLRLDLYRDAVTAAVVWAGGLGFGAFAAVAALWLLLRERWRPGTGRGPRPASYGVAVGSAAALTAIAILLVFRTGVWPIGEIDMISGSFAVVPANAAAWTAASIGCLAVAVIVTSRLVRDLMPGDPP